MKPLSYLMTTFCLIVLFGCSGQKQIKTLVLGVTEGPSLEIAQDIAKASKQAGIELEIITFPSIKEANQALDQGLIDANSCQSEAFMLNENRLHAHGFKAFAKSFIIPWRLYSQQHLSIDDIPNNALIAIPQHPSNKSRALLLLEYSGLIKLHKDSGHLPSVFDIKENPKDLRFTEHPLQHLPYQLDTADLVVIDSEKALIMNSSEGIYLISIEPASSPYAHIIAVKPEGANNSALKKLIKLYRSSKTQTFIAQRFKQLVKPAH